MAGRSRSGQPVLGAVGLALLAVPGFALGVLAGVAWEDPGLLASHLLGRSVEAPWGSVASSQPEPLAADRPLPRPEPPAPPAKQLPDVAAPAPRPAPTPVKEAPRAAKPPPRAAKEAPRAAKSPPRAAKEAPRAAKSPPTSAAAPSPATRLRPEVLSPAGSERFAVQVGAFAESRSAEGLVEQLRAKGFEAYVSPSAKPGSARWRVRVGPLPTREKAEGVADRLKAEEKLPTWVLDENAV